MNYTLVDRSPKNVSSVISFSHSCSSKPVRPSFFFGTQIKIFFMKSDSFRTLHRQQRNWNMLWSKKGVKFNLKVLKHVMFFAHKKYYSSFIKLWLNHSCHMDYFNDVLNIFLGLEHVSCVVVYGGSECSRISSKNLNLCSEDERRSYRFGTTQRWVINDSIFIFGWTIPLSFVKSAIQ